MTPSNGSPKAAHTYARIMLVLGIFFIVVAVLNLFIGRLIDAGWSFGVGIGNVFTGYAQMHPEMYQVRGKLAWALSILYLVVMVVLTYLKLTQT